jgi:hypothetical protein
MFARKRRLRVDSRRSVRPRSTLNFPRTGLGALVALALIVGCDRGQQPQPVTPTRAAGNALNIHLQDGFRRGSEVIITIDGREVYRGRPKTVETVGLAAKVPATAATTRPVVALTVPAEGISWSQEIDLSAGHALGISLTANQQVRLLQGKAAHAYE